MLDFTSVLYLDMRHPKHELRPWMQLTTGRPAALEATPEAERVAQELARLLRCERATLAASTLHLFWDLFDILTGNSAAIYLDAGTYPIARWGVERATAKGIPLSIFEMHDPNELEVLLRRDRRVRRRPVVVTDGVWPETGQVAPLPEYLRLVQEHDGYLIIDDTQALGILGHRPGGASPYGRGGAGTPAWHGIEGPELIVASSLAKGFGAPLAVIAGNARLVADFESLSTTRVHCSPPSLAVIAAAERALAVNVREGDRRRSKLANLVQCFRRALRQAGLSSSGGLFPVQTLKTKPEVDPTRLHDQLLRLGVRTVLHRAHDRPDARISFLIGAMHTSAEILEAVVKLHTACAVLSHQSRGACHAATLHLRAQS